MIGAVAAIGSAVGGAELVTGAIDQTVMKVIPATFRTPMMMFGIVFVSDFVYNMFLA